MSRGLDQAIRDAVETVRAERAASKPAITTPVGGFPTAQIRDLWLDAIRAAGGKIKAA